MKRIFVYPVGDPQKSISKNPYIFDMISSITKKYILVNDFKNYTKLGILDAIINYTKTDVYIFNWVENIPNRKFGVIQSFLFVFLSFLIKVSKKEYIWVLHNKNPHNGKNRLSNINMYFAAYHSTKIITHASEGLETIHKKYGLRIAKKTNYIPHPTNINEYTTIKEEIKKKQKQINIEYDFIIWGAINEYKGIDKFLDYIKNKNEWEKIKLLICGKPISKAYLNKLYQLKNNNVKIIGQYISDNYLIELVLKSRAILFVYNNSNSVLSSGALIKSLYFPRQIIGPYIGAFKDLEDCNLISTYKDYNQILSLYQMEKFKDTNLRYEFIQKNKWENLIVNFLS